MIAVKGLSDRKRIGSGPPIPIDGRGICTTDMRCRRRLLGERQRLIVFHEGSPALSCLQRRIPRRG